MVFEEKKTGISFKWILCQEKYMPIPQGERVLAKRQVFAEMMPQY